MEELQVLVNDERRELSWTGLYNFCEVGLQSWLLTKCNDCSFDRFPSIVFLLYLSSSCSSKLGMNSGRIHSPSTAVMSNNQPYFGGSQRPLPQQQQTSQQQQQGTGWQRRPMPPQEALFSNQHNGVRPPRPTGLPQDPRFGPPPGNAPPFPLTNSFGGPRPPPVTHQGMGFPPARPPAPAARPPPGGYMGTPISSDGFGTPPQFKPIPAQGGAAMDPRLFQPAGQSPTANAFPGSSTPNNAPVNTSYAVSVDPRFTARPNVPSTFGGQSIDPRFASTPVSNLQSSQPLSNTPPNTQQPTYASDPRFQPAANRIPPLDPRIPQVPAPVDPRLAIFPKSTTPPYPPSLNLPLLPGPPPVNLPNPASQPATVIKQEQAVGTTTESGKLRPMFCVVCASNNVRCLPLETGTRLMNTARRTGPWRPMTFYRKSQTAITATSIS